MDNQGVRILRTNSTDDSSNKHLVEMDKLMFAKQEEEETVVRVYSESTLTVFGSGAIPNVMLQKMVEKLRIRMMSTTRRIKIANFTFYKCVNHLRDMPIQMGQ